MPETYPKLPERADGDRISILPSVSALGNDRVDIATFLDFPGKFILNETCWEHWMVWKKHHYGWHNLDLKQ